MAVGLIAAAAVLLAGTGFGLWRGRRDGRVRPRSAAPGGAVPGRPGGGPAGGGPRALVLGAGDLGVSELGTRATLVQFSSAFCAPCRATRRILAEVAGMVEGVRHVDIDVTARLDLARRLGVRRTPTTFVLGPDGQVTHRASGQPRKADVIAALGTGADFPT